MNLEELIGLMHRKLNQSGSRKFTKAEIKEVYKSLIDVMHDKLEEEADDLTSNMKKSFKLTLPLIGKFKIVRQDSYYGKNPKTKEKVKISANNRIYYSPYKSLKDIINK